MKVTVNNVCFYRGKMKPPINHYCEPGRRNVSICKINDYKLNSCCP